MSIIQEKLTKIKNRFKDAKFSISCFDTTNDIETKILNDTDEYIIYADKYNINSYSYCEKTKKRITIRENNDYFIIKRKEGQSVIYYKDVIDYLIENNFIRDDCDHRYMENIRECYKHKRNDKSIKVYSSFWGS